jgi:hypothetical protein
MRIDHYLTRKAARAWPRALVVDEDGRFTLRRPDRSDVVLADVPTPIERRFHAAREALRQLAEYETGEASE